MENPIVIVAAARTPMGSFQGELSSESAPQLAAAAISAALEKADVQPNDVEQVVMGNVLSAGIGQAPARQAALFSNIPDKTPATTLNKMCGSGMRAVMTAEDMLALGRSDVMVAGGMESMTNAPYLLPKARGGMRLGHNEVKDHMFLDGLEDAYEHRLMGTYAEEAAQNYQFTREEQDAYAIASLKRANDAQVKGRFANEIATMTLKTRNGEVTVSSDQQPRTADTSKIPTLKPAFAKDGTVTAANSSSISDGAAALVMMTENTAKGRGLTPLARIVGQSSYAHAPGLFTTAPVFAMNNLLDQINWSIDEVDLWEINEAFAVVPMIAMRDMKLDHDKVNIHGGACALGHPIGASGARIIVTLLNALQDKKLKRGIASLCIGGGEATAMAFELY